MTLCVLKINFQKRPPEFVNQRDYSEYHNANFMNYFKEVLNEHENKKQLLNKLDSIYKVHSVAFNEQAP